MTTTTHPRRLIAAVAAALALTSLASCTPTPNPAETTVLAYIPSADAGDGKWCELDWNYRANVDHCKATVGKTAAAHQLMADPVLVRTLPAQPGKEDAGQIVLVRVPYKLYTPVEAYRVLRDPSTGRWLVEKYAEVHGDPADDAAVRQALA